MLFSGCSAFCTDNRFISSMTRSGNQRYRGDDATGQAVQEQTLRQPATTEPTEEENVLVHG